MKRILNAKACNALLIYPRFDADTFWNFKRTARSLRGQISGIAAWPDHYRGVAAASLVDKTGQPQARQFRPKAADARGAFAAQPRQSRNVASDHDQPARTARGLSQHAEPVHVWQSDSIRWLVALMALYLHVRVMSFSSRWLSNRSRQSSWQARILRCDTPGPRSVFTLNTFAGSSTSPAFRPDRCGPLLAAEHPGGDRLVALMGLGRVKTLCDRAATGRSGDVGCFFRL